MKIQKGRDFSEISIKIQWISDGNAFDNFICIMVVILLQDEIISGIYMMILSWIIGIVLSTLQWCHNQRFPNHQPYDCLLNCLFKAQIKENIKAPRHWPLWGEFPGEFPAQRASTAENVSISWRHHDFNHGIMDVITSFYGVSSCKVTYNTCHLSNYIWDYYIGTLSSVQVTTSRNLQHPGTPMWH